MSVINRDIFNSDDPADERKMIEKAVAGDREAFSMIMEKYAKTAYNLCYRFLGNSEDAEDCAQEVFLKIYRNLEKFAFRSSFSTWFYRITVNSCKNYRSSKQFRKKTMETSISAKYNDSETTMEIRDKSCIPEDEIVRREQYETVLSAIRKLPDDLGKVVMLRDVENCSYEEISDITGYRMGTVKSKLSRARRHLREELRGML